MSANNNTERPTDVRSTIIQSVAEVAERNPDDKDLQLSAERLERSERARDASSSQHEPKEANNSKPDGDEDKPSQPKPKAADADTSLVDDANTDADKSTKQSDEHDTEANEKDSNKDKDDPSRKITTKLPKEVAAEYDNLPSATKQFIARQVKENNDIKSQLGRKTDVERVLAPYEPEMKRLGVQPSQVVSKLLVYSDALASPQHQAAALVKLCQDFKIDLVGVANQVQDYYVQQEQLPPAQRELSAKLDNVLNRLSYQDQQALMLQQEQQRQVYDEKAKSALDAWATKSGAQHFNNSVVKTKMHELIMSNPSLYTGEQFTDTGNINLRKAYADACEVLGEGQPFKTKPQNSSQKQPQRSTQRQQHRSAKGKDTSARGSIRAAIEEMRQHGTQR